MATLSSSIPEILEAVAQRISAEQLSKELGEEADKWLLGGGHGSRDDLWRVIRILGKYGFFDLLPAHGVPPVAYNLSSPFDLVAAPVGFDLAPPADDLIKRPTEIGGFQVDFPFGLPASVLAANAKWIEFYARRGVDILTYKTVRTQYQDVNAWPNWVFIEPPEDPEGLLYGKTKAVGAPGYWPDSLSTASMANSFGVPSFAPDWWQEDVRRAKGVVREGHQVLIVSVVASVQDSIDAIADDFAKAAALAKDAGADIVEGNFSCPNTPDSPAGELYQHVENSVKVAAAMKQALRPSPRDPRDTPLFVKIGYLAEPELRAFVERSWQYIDGVVGINTLQAEVVRPDGEHVFPARPVAGISGWAIARRAEEVAKNLAEVRDEILARHGKRLTVLSVGGILTAEDVHQRLEVGVDGAESCTGAFLNPNLGLEVRRPEHPTRRPNRLMFELEALAKFLDDAVLHPTRKSRVRMDSRNRRVFLEHE